MALFPTQAWLEALKDKLNSDEHYAQVAKNWEGDMIFAIESDDGLKEQRLAYLDLWHGKCRQAFFLKDGDQKKAAFVLKAPYLDFVKVLTGEYEPMQALLTRKLGVQGSMAILMRNVPTVLDFVRCAREVTTGKI
jgi:putative sterol carrier protein